jgi:hypothetical protein
MTAKQMTPSQQQRFTRICEDQGIKVTRTKKGLLLRFPDGTSTVQHFTTSDVKANQNQIARFRRAGVMHPDDNRVQKELPNYITGGSITANTRKKILDYILSRDIPEVVYQKDVSKDLNMDPGWANRALYHTGFRPGKAKNSKVGRPWYTPEDILALRPTMVHDPVVGEEPAEAEWNDGPVLPIQDAAVGREEKPMPRIGLPDPVLEEREATPAEEAAILESINNPDFVEVGPPTPEVKTEGQREFIDTHESWVVEPGQLFGKKFEQFMKDELRVLEALGLEFEIRVWRKPE